MEASQELEAIRMLVFGADGRFPDIVWDGIAHPERAGEQYAICVDNGDAQVLNVDGQNQYANPAVEGEAHRCTHPTLKAVTLVGL